MRTGGKNKKKKIEEQMNQGKGLVETLDSLGEDDKAKMAFMMEQLQVRDSLRFYNTLVQRCFSDCVDTFWQKNLNKEEDKCVRRCTEKFLKLSMRAGLRFAELNQAEEFNQK